MVFTHDTEIALQAAVTLANSGLDPDTLTTVGRPRPASGTATTTPAATTAPGPSWTPCARSAPRLRDLLTADRDEAVELVNAMLSEARRSPSLVRHDRHDWHIHATEPDEPFDRRILVETAMAMIDVIRSDEMSRLAVCADDTCEGVVLDLSRNRSRRFCSTTCGNRNAVAAYRARQR